jgi:hypothetical protein
MIMRFEQITASFKQKPATREETQEIHTMPHSVYWVNAVKFEENISQAKVWRDVTIPACRVIGK